MGKSHTVYVCGECGSQFPRWQGRCGECGAWNALVEEQPVVRKTQGMALNVGTGAEPVLLSEVDSHSEPRFSTGVPELDRVLGGGFVKGSLVLVGGPPGIGKSTLLLQVAGNLGKPEAPVIYVSGEESPQQIRLRADRLACFAGRAPGAGIVVLPETSLESIEAFLQQREPGVVIVDSIQTVYRADLAPAPGSVTQVRECAAQLMRLAKSHGCTIILVGHVTKGGELAGPRVLEHLVDTVLHFEANGVHNLRALRAIKNRFGSTREMAFFEMRAEGLEAIPDASSFFLSQRAENTPGTVVFPSMEGTRPVLVEIQALVSQSYAVDQGAPPTRRSVGLDVNRVSLLLAVLQKRLGAPGLGRSDVYVNVAGGVRLAEPALDLPLVLAVLSSQADRELPGDLAAFGEVGLGGEVRAVSGLEARLNELYKLGFRRCLVPSRSLKGKGGMRALLASMGPQYALEEGATSGSSGSAGVAGAAGAASRREGAGAAGAADKLLVLPVSRVSDALAAVGLSSGSRRGGKTCYGTHLREEED